MLREDGTSYLNVLKVQTSIELGGQEITATPSTTGANVSIDPTGMTNVTAENVQSAIAQLDNLVGGGGGSYTEPTIFGTHYTITGNFAGTDCIIAQAITIPSGGNGSYEIEAKISYYLSNGTSNQTISVIKNDTVQTGVLVSDIFTGEVVGTHAHTLKYYLNNLVATDTIRINVNTSSAGNVNNSVCQLTAKKLQNTVTISTTSESQGGGV